MEETNKIIILSKEDVKKFKQSSDKLEFHTQKPEMKWGFIIVTAPWCGHCQDFQPDIEFLAKHLSEHQVYFFKLMLGFIVPLVIACISTAFESILPAAII